MATVRRLPVPSRLTQMLDNNFWQHPGDEAILRVMPFMTDPLMFPSSLDHMISASRVGITDHDGGDPLSIHRGSRILGDSTLPWLDIERAFFIAFNEIPGDDVAIALDYPWDINVPRVVASKYTDAVGYKWLQVAPTFFAFVDSLGM